MKLGKNTLKKSRPIRVNCSTLVCACRASTEAGRQWGSSTAQGNLFRFLRSSHLPRCEGGTNPSHTAVKGMKAMYRVWVRWHCQRAAGLSVRRGPAGAWLGPTDKMGAPLWWHTQERTKTGKEKVKKKERKSTSVKEVLQLLKEITPQPEGNLWSRAGLCQRTVACGGDSHRSRVNV